MEIVSDSGIPQANGPKLSTLRSRHKKKLTPTNAVGIPSSQYLCCPKQGKGAIKLVISVTILVLDHKD